MRRRAGGRHGREGRGLNDGVPGLAFGGRVDLNPLNVIIHLVKLHMYPSKVFDCDH